MPSNGFLVLDKPLGISSAKAVAEVKKILKCKKIGHGGTLDPLASGVLPLAIGEATKAFDYVASSIKQYRFTVTFGEERATDDAEGQVTAQGEHLPTRQELLNVLPIFIGKILQVPPAYSALKIDGKRAYAMARAGEKVEMTARPVDIHKLELLVDSTATGPIGHATFEVTCGKGFYVRALGRDIARKCSSLGYISVLRRTRVGKFAETEAISLDKLTDFVHNPALFKAWVPLELALDDIPAIEVNQKQAQALRHGQAVGMDKPEGRYMALHQGRLVAMVRSGLDGIRPVRVFNLNEEE